MAKIPERNYQKVKRFTLVQFQRFQPMTGRLLYFGLEERQIPWLSRVGHYCSFSSRSRGSQEAESQRAATDKI
jgi:hypothetical protein